LFAILLGCLISPVLVGCSMLDTRAPLAAQSQTPSTPASAPPAPLSWLTNWVSQPIEMAPGFDIESLKPAPRPAVVGQEDLIEVTIWDLYEPGKPYSFPVRVSGRHTIEVPMLGEVHVEGRTISQIESNLIDAFRKGEYLLNPRVLVRSLDAPIIKVQVAGAVNRAGFVELTRSDRSVYAAVLSAGSLKKSSGSQVGITHRADVRSAEITPAPRVTESPQEQPVGAPVDETVNQAANETVTETVAEPNPPHAPEQRANSVDDISVPAAAPVVRPAVADRPLFSVGPAVANDARQVSSRSSAKVVAATGPGAGGQRRIPVVDHGEQSTTWYDAALAHDRDQLKSLVLADGDIVTIKEAAPPLRIGGFVNHPGSYPLPPGRTLNAWQAIELAGGVRDEAIPLNITLLRPAGDGHGARRWYLNVVEFQQHPTASPLVEPGDVLQVDPTTGSKIKKAVGDLWSKP